MQPIIQSAVTEIMQEAFADLDAINCEAVAADPDEGMPAEVTYHQDYLIDDASNLRSSAFTALHNLNAVEGVVATLEFFSWNDKREQFVLTVVDEFEDEEEDASEEDSYERVILESMSRLTDEEAARTGLVARAIAANAEKF